MIVSPESFYSAHLYGKSTEEIISVINNLKQRIYNLQGTMEHPQYGSHVAIIWEDLNNIYYNRQYLEKAIEAYEEAGGEYLLTEAEMRTINFQDNINEITKITYSFFGFGTPSQKYIAVLSNDLKIYKTMIDNGESLSLIDNNNSYSTVESFRDKLKQLYIGEWRDSYSREPSNIIITDLMRWDLLFEYNNEHKPAKFSGYGSYPYNFDALHRLIAIDYDESL